MDLYQADHNLDLKWQQGQSWGKLCKCDCHWITDCFKNFIEVENKYSTHWSNTKSFSSFPIGFLVWSVFLNLMEDNVSGVNVLF